MVPEKQWEGAGPERTQQGKVVHYEVWHFRTASLDVWIAGIRGERRVSGRHQWNSFES